MIRMVGEFSNKSGSVKDEWDNAADSWMNFVRKGKDYYRDKLNNPAAFRLIGDVTAQSVLDLACGEGYNARILARKGAKVTGIDFSQNMIELAKQVEAEENLGITYYVLDAANLENLSDDRFNLVTCFMSLQDIEDYKRAISEVSRVLKLRGRFVFSVPHPCFETITAKGRRVEVARRYFGETKYHIEWNMERLEKPFRTTSFHRTLTDYFTALHNNNLFVSRLIEPRPTEEGMRKYPPLREVLVRPQSLIIESTKCHPSKIVQKG